MGLSKNKILIIRKRKEKKKKRKKKKKKKKKKEKEKKRKEDKKKVIKKKTNFSGIKGSSSFFSSNSISIFLLCLGTTTKATNKPAMHPTPRPQMMAERRGM